MIKYRHYLIFTVFIPLILICGCLEVATTTDIDYDIKTRCIQNVNYDRSTENFTVAVIRNNGTLMDYSRPIISFTVTPHLKSIRDKDDYAYLLFSVTDYEKQLFKDSDGIYQLKWQDENGDIWLMHGERRITLDETITLTLTLNLNPFQLINVESSSLDINFMNYDNTWSESYHAILRGIDI